MGCSRRVHNLDGMDDAQRKEFLTGCSGAVCVAYSARVPRRTAVALGLGVAAALTASAASAQLVEPEVMQQSPTAESAQPLGPAPMDDCDDLLEIIVVGGTGADADRIAYGAASDLEQLPIGDGASFLDADGEEFVAVPGGDPTLD